MPQLPSSPADDSSHPVSPAPMPIAPTPGEGQGGRIFVIALLVVLGGTLAWTALSGLFPPQQTPATREALLALHSAATPPHAASVGSAASSTPSSNTAQTPASTKAAPDDDQAPTVITRAPESALELRAALAEVEAFLRSKHSTSEIVRMLEQLRARLMHAQPGAALQVISEYLSSGRDLGTTLDFEVGKGGWLETAPTLRTFMLDTLGEADPAAGAAYAKTILDQPPGSPEEWALSLRNLVQHDEAMATDPYLAAKTRELVTNPAWLANPSLGFLEAFDFVVFTKQTELAPLMAGYYENTQLSEGLQFAAYLTLDNLVIANPAALLPQLAANPHLLDSRPAVRATEFARANVADPAQRAAVENYLLRTDLSPFEVSQFMSGFPWHGQGIGNNLATQPVLPTLQQVAEQDVASLAVVNEWLADPRFAGRQADLLKLRADLQQLIKSDQRGGLLQESDPPTVTLQ